MILIKKLEKQLRKAKPNSIISVDSFGDNSESWIEIRPKVKRIDILKPNYIIVEVLSFNRDGTRLEDVSCYKENIRIDFDSEKIV